MAEVGWAFGFSGTEPIIRLYLEADNPKQLDILEKAGRSLLVGQKHQKKPKKRVEHYLYGSTRPSFNFVKSLILQYRF